MKLMYIMITNCFILIIISLGCLEFCYGGYFSTNYCSGYGEETYYEIVCTDPDKFPKDLPPSTEKLTIICSNNSPKNKSIISGINENQINQYNFLTLFSIQNCPINELPDKLFTNLPYLQSVTINGLPIQRLRNIFYRTENLLEVILMNLFNLEHIDSHIFDSQKSFSRFVLDNTTVTSDNLNKILKPIKKIIRELRIINNRNDLMKFPSDIFGNYQFGLLDLQNNRLLDWNFLSITKSRKILLRNSHAVKPFMELSKYSYLHMYCELIDLENTGIVGIFPTEIDKSFQHVKSLSVKSNSIESLHNNIDSMFPRLQILDISNNKIRHLQSDLNNLFYKTEFFKLEGNPLHCNCQLRWLSARYKSKIQDYPRCNFGYRKSNIRDKNITVENIFFSQLATDRLICLPPRTPVLSIAKADDPTKLTTSEKNKFESKSIIKKEYTLVLNSNQLVELNCETEGDPIPTLVWSDQNNTLLTRNPPPHISHLSNRITVGLEGSNVSSIYMCTASNIEGVSFALLNLVSKKIDKSQFYNQNTSNVIYGKIISNLNYKNCASNHFAQFSEFSAIIDFMWKILYFLTFNLINKYIF